MNTTACTTRAQKNRAAAPDTLVSVSCAMITSVANAGRFSIMFKCALCARCAQGAGGAGVAGYPYVFIRPWFMIRSKTYGSQRTMHRSALHAR